MSDHKQNTTTLKESKPKTETYILNIGKQLRTDKGYITDELMTITNPEGVNKISQPLSRFIPNPTLENKQGDIVKWKCQAGTHIKGEKLKELVEKEEGLELTRYEEDIGRFDSTRMEVEVMV